MLQELRPTWEPDEWFGVIVVGYRTYTCTKGLRKPSYQRILSLLLNIKRLLRIDVPIPGILGDRWSFSCDGKCGEV